MFDFKKILKTINHLEEIYTAVKTASFYLFPFRNDRPAKTTYQKRKKIQPLLKKSFKSANVVCKTKNLLGPTLGLT